jgi:hypothetical protein
VLEGFSITGGIERDGVLFAMKGEKADQVKDLVETWLKKLRILQ